MLKDVTATVKQNENIASGIYRMVLRSPEADLVHFVPGQFANLAIPGRSDLLLKRPFSINKVDADAATVTVIYQVVGEGTDALTALVPGDKIEVIMPVGAGFQLKKEHKEVFLVGGGVGIAPLLPVIKRWPDRNYHAFLGYRSADFVYCLEEFQEVCDGACVASDDGTIGMEGFVTDALKQKLDEYHPDIILACGPEPMLRALKDVLAPLNLPCQVSMEQRMGCGFGACAVCVCGIQHGDGLENKKVCVEGPVFDLYEVVL